MEKTEAGMDTPWYTELWMELNAEIAEETGAGVSKGETGAEIDGISEEAGSIDEATEDP